MMDLSGKVAIVTGAARGIGRAAAEALHAAGASVAVVDLDEAGAQAVASALGDRAVGVRVDIGDSASVETMVERVKSEFGGVDILVNNAGICKRGRTVSMPESDWDQVIRVNLKGTFLCCRAVLPSMLDRGWGRIVNVASIAGKIGGLMVGVHYAASKGGVLALTKGVAREVAGNGITVNAVCPALAGTEMSGMFGEEEIENYLRGVPLHRLASPEDVASAIAYLCSEDASYITGETLDVNGGLLMD